MNAPLPRVAPAPAEPADADDPLVQLARRRAYLLVRSGLLRAALAADGARIGRQLTTADRGVRFARTRLARPLLFAGLVAVIAAGPSRVLGLAGRALMLWPALRPLLGPAGRGALRALAPVLARWLARRQP